MQNSQQNESLKELIQQKIAKFEEVRTEWTVQDVMSWLLLIESGHFNGVKYNSFRDQLIKLNVNGEKLPEMNSKILLSMMGLNDKDQSLLLRNICRVSEIWTESKRRDLCGLCMEKRIDSVMIPCGHQYSCYKCLTENQITKCPICRRHISQKVKTFMNGF